MARSTVAPARRAGRAFIPPALTLARWRLGRTWRLLASAGLGMLAAVMLVCAVPLFSQVATSAGLRDALRADPFGDSVSVTARVDALTSALAQQSRSTLDPIVQRDMGSYLTGATQFSIQTQSFPILTRSHGQAQNSLRLIGEDLATATSHITIMQGTLPADGATTLEILLDADTAQQLNAPPGASLKLALNGSDSRQSLTARVVGIFTPNDAHESFWHDLSFTPAPGGGSNTIYSALAANDTLLSALKGLTVGVNNDLSQQPAFTWSYPLDVTRLNGNNVDAINRQFDAMQVETADALHNVQGVVGVEVDSGINVLAAFQQRSSVVQVPIALLLAQVLGLALFFVSLMADIVVERQSEAIAVLRSRGASRGQIFGAFAVQSVGLSLAALIAGPLLAILGVQLIARHALAAGDQDALNIISGNPLATALSIGWYIVIAVAGVLLAMLISVNRAMSGDVLTLRREAARATRRPLWQRMNLDVVAAVIGVTGYVSYTLTVQRLDPTVQVALSPLALIAPLFLLISAALLFLRVFPLLVQWGAHLAARGSGSAAMLALAQMARAPRQAMRTTLLLALSIAFAIFTMIFAASQQQHTRDAAAYSVGADFSAALPPGGTGIPRATFLQIPGVISASLGYQASVPPSGNATDMPMELRAVDAGTFAQTAIWTPQDSAQPVADLMQTLRATRSQAEQSSIVPAIVDDAAWQGLHLDHDPHFALSVPGFTGSAMRFVAVARVAHIPTIFDAAGNGDAGGVLTDLTSYDAVFRQSIGVPVTPNIVWLRTQDDPASLASVRGALASTLHLHQVQDRRAEIAAAQTDPLNVDLLGALGIGAVTACVLGVLGALIASWLSAHSRLTNFTVLRALGGDARQIVSLLLWENGCIYGAALVLGIALGAVLASVVLPTLIFTSAVTTDAQSTSTPNVPPIQTVIPAGEVGALLGGLALVFVVALALMTRVVARPAVSQTLRLNED